VLPEKLQKLANSLLPESVFFRFLEQRKQKLEGVSVCGGEPCMQKDIVSFCGRLKQQGFLVKVDTNGLFPEKLKQLLDAGVVDYVAMDIKTSKEQYDDFV